MFVYSVRASTIRFFSVIALTFLVLIGVLIINTSGESSALAMSDEIDFSGVKTNEDRIKFIEQFGIKVKDSAKEEVSFRIPESFDRVISGYNEIQKSQGLDLSRYKNKKVTRYTYEAENVPGHDGAVLVNITVFRNTVVACDISSTSPDGFVEPLIKLN
jgi:hypothetical protein